MPWSSCGLQAWRSRRAVAPRLLAVSGIAIWARIEPQTGCVVIRGQALHRGFTTRNRGDDSQSESRSTNERRLGRSDSAPGGSPIMAAPLAKRRVP
jgi:hypothetical protein